MQTPLASGAQVWRLEGNFAASLQLFPAWKTRVLEEVSEELKLPVLLEQYHDDLQRHDDKGKWNNHCGEAPSYDSGKGDGRTFQV